MKEKPLAFLSLVKLLETVVGHQTTYAILDPFPCITSESGKPAIVPIQNAGKIIAQHLKLGDLTFIISVTTHDQRTAGHIELKREGSEVFVEIATDICGFGDAVLATIAHELCHKFLHVHGIRHGFDQIEQEYLTDVTAVYLGLGKIMLNGCECESSRARVENGRTVTTTQTLRTGYISRDCFAFVYRLVSAMRDIPADKFLMGLSSDARSAVAKSECEYADWFKTEYRSPEGLERTASELRELVMSCQDDAAVQHRKLRRLGESIKAVESRIYKSHSPLREAQNKIAELTESEPNPHLRFLNCLEAKESVTQHALNSKEQVAGIENTFEKLGPVASAVCSDSHALETEILECPLDGTKFRVPGGRSRLLVTCPSCKYKFVADTANCNNVQGRNVKRQRKWGFLNSFKSMFGRKQ